MRPENDMIPGFTWLTMNLLPQKYNFLQILVPVAILSEKGYDFRHFSPVLPVFLPEIGNKVSLFIIDTNQDINRHTG